VATGDSGREAYTAIAWDVGLSHERSYIAGAESLDLILDVNDTAARNVRDWPVTIHVPLFRAAHYEVRMKTIIRQLKVQRAVTDLAPTTSFTGRLFALTHLRTV
jgi:hypothetical protein